MKIHPILAALRKHKAGVVLIGIQIALTLAIVCNIYSIVASYVDRVGRPTGLEEDDLFLIAQSYVDLPNDQGTSSRTSMDSMQLTDLSVLRNLPDIQSASSVSSLPLLRRNSIQDISLKPAQQRGFTKASFFFGDEQFLPTLGLRLIAGRNFNVTDIEQREANDKVNPPLVIITKALSDRLFPSGKSVGKPIYVNNATTPSVVIGVVSRMLTSDADGIDYYAWNSVIAPGRIDASSTMYAVRARPGRLQEAMDQARQALFKVNPLRIIQERGRFSPSGVHAYKEIRDMGYALDLFVVQILTVICAILLAVTAVGITGLTSFWVSQRHKQIGVRRALGATKFDILKYFQLENLFIAGGGCIIGVLMAVGVNVQLSRMFEINRIPMIYLIVGVVVVVILGQIAALVPALRASNISPAVATRSI